MQLIPYVDYLQHLTDCPSQVTRSIIKLYLFFWQPFNNRFLCPTCIPVGTQASSPQWSPWKTKVPSQLPFYLAAEFSILGHDLLLTTLSFLGFQDNTLLWILPTFLTPVSWFLSLFFSLAPTASKWNKPQGLVLHPFPFLCWIFRWLHEISWLMTINVVSLACISPLNSKPVYPIAFMFKCSMSLTTLLIFLLVNSNCYNLLIMVNGNAFLLIAQAKALLTTLFCSYSVSDLSGNSVSSCSLGILKMLHWMTLFM